MTTPSRAERPPGRRAQVLQLLRDADEPLGIAEIGDRLGIHANTARFHLQTLVDHGQVECVTAERGTPGRPPQLFRVIRGMDPMGPRRYRGLSEVLITAMVADAEPGDRAVEAGRTWGHRYASAESAVGDGGPDDRAPVNLLVGMLDEWGFAPEDDDDGEPSQIRLRNCPFFELAVDHAEVVCPVHLGLMRGAMESWGSSVTVDRLDAFVEPDLCMVHLGPAPAS